MKIYGFFPDEHADEKVSHVATVFDKTVAMSFLGALLSVILGFVAVNFGFNNVGFIFLALTIVLLGFLCLRQNKLGSQCVNDWIALFEAQENCYKTEARILYGAGLTNFLMSPEGQEIMLRLNIDFEDFIRNSNRDLVAIRRMGRGYRRSKCFCYLFMLEFVTDDDQHIVFPYIIENNIGSLIPPDSVFFKHPEKLVLDVWYLITAGKVSCFAHSEIGRDIVVAKESLYNTRVRWSLRNIKIEDFGVSV